MTARQEALSAATRWLRQIALAGVSLDPVLTIALQDAARALDRARATDDEGRRLAYVSRELRAARLDIIALIPANTTEDPWAEFYATAGSTPVRDPG